MKLDLLFTILFLIEKREDLCAYESDLPISERFNGQETRGVVSYPTYAFEGRKNDTCVL